MVLIASSDFNYLLVQNWFMKIVIEIIRHLTSMIITIKGVETVLFISMFLSRPGVQKPNQQA
jgi:hypothetical protein